MEFCFAKQKESQELKGHPSRDAELENQGVVPADHHCAIRKSSIQLHLPALEAKGDSPFKRTVALTVTFGGVVVEEFCEFFVYVRTEGGIFEAVEMTPCYQFYWCNLFRKNRKEFCKRQQRS